MGLLKLADKYFVERLEAACYKALSYSPHPSYKSVKNILATGQYKVNTSTEAQAALQTEDNSYGYTHGAEYYGGKNQ